VVPLLKHKTACQRGSGIGYYTLTFPLVLARGGERAGVNRLFFRHARLLDPASGRDTTGGLLSFLDGDTRHVYIYDRII
jgi:hypothetical protein